MSIIHALVLTENSWLYLRGKGLKIRKANSGNIRERYQGTSEEEYQGKTSEVRCLTHRPFLPETFKTKVKKWLKM